MGDTSRPQAIASIQCRRKTGPVLDLKSIPSICSRTRGIRLQPSFFSSAPPHFESPGRERPAQTGKEHEVRRVLFLSASSGGGHDGTARVLQDLIGAACGSPQAAQILDVYQGRLRTLPWLARIRHRSAWVWATFFKLTEVPWVLTLVRRLMAPPLIRLVFERLEGRPDLIVATHFVGAQILDDVASRLSPRPATLIVATDYRPHLAWFGRADCVLVSEAPGRSLARRAYPPGQTIVTTRLLPCMPPLPRRRSGGRQDRLRLVAVMGADGTSGRRLERLLRGLMAHPWSSGLQVDVVCGRNLALKERLSRALGNQTHPAGAEAAGPAVTISGYVTDLQLRLAEADICLARASPLVLTESLAAGTPVLAFDWAAHEAANATLIESWGCGKASRDTGTLIETLALWVRNPALLRNLQARAKAIGQQGFGVEDMRALLRALSLSEGVPCAAS